MSGQASSSVSAPLGGIRLGLTAGLLLGALEALERIWALRAFLRGGAESAWLAGLILFFPLLVGALFGLVGGGGVAAAAVARRAVALPAAAWRALCGAALGLALAAWGVFALTLTVRFDRLIARWPAVLAGACAAGALCGLAWGPLAAHFTARWMTAAER